MGDKRPDYYGGKNDPYEVFKVIRAWGVDFFGGNVLKYIRRAGKKIELGDDPHSYTSQAGRSEQGADLLEPDDRGRGA